MALRVGKGISEVVKGRLSASEEWSGGTGGGSRKDRCCLPNYYFICGRKRYCLRLTSPGPWSRGPVSRGVSLSSFVCRFGISLLYFLDSSVKVYRAPSCCIGWILSGQEVSLFQINTIFAVERGIFDVSLSQGLRAGSELSGISLSSFWANSTYPFSIT